MGAQLCSFPPSPWAVWLLDRLELIRGMQETGEGDHRTPGLHRSFSQALAWGLSHLLVTCAISEWSSPPAPCQIPELCMELQSRAESNVLVGSRCLLDSYPSLQISETGSCPAVHCKFPENLRCVRWLTVSSHPGRKELSLSPPRHGKTPFSLQFLSIVSS